MREPQKVCFTKLLESSQFKSLEPLCSVIISSFLLYIQKVTSRNLIIYFLIQWSPPTSLLFCLHSVFFFLSFLPISTIRYFFFLFSHIPHSSFKFYLWVDLGLGHSYNGLLLSCYQLTNTIFHKRCPRTSWKQSIWWVSTWNHHSLKSLWGCYVFIYLFSFLMIKVSWVKKIHWLSAEVSLTVLELFFLVSIVSKVINFRKSKCIAEILNQSRNKC